MILVMFVLDVAACLMRLMRVLMWRLAHAIDGCVDMDGCFVFALCVFFVLVECANSIIYCVCMH